MRELLRKNENADAAFHLFLSFVVLYLLAGFIHPYLLGIGSVDIERYAADNARYEELLATD